MNKAKANDSIELQFITITSFTILKFILHIHYSCNNRNETLLRLKQAATVLKIK